MKFGICVLRIPNQDTSIYILNLMGSLDFSQNLTGSHEPLETFLTKAPNHKREHLLFDIDLSFG